MENRLHPPLDVTFCEDQRRIGASHGAENGSRLCRLALDLPNRDTSARGGVQTEHLQAGWDNDSLLQLISR